MPAPTMTAATHGTERMASCPSQRPRHERRWSKITTIWRVARASSRSMPSVRMLVVNPSSTPSPVRGRSARRLGGHDGSRPSRCSASMTQQAHHGAAQEGELGEDRVGPRRVEGVEDDGADDQQGGEPVDPVADERVEGREEAQVEDDLQVLEGREADPEQGVERRQQHREAPAVGVRAEGVPGRLLHREPVLAVHRLHVAPRRAPWPGGCRARSRRPSRGPGGAGRGRGPGWRRGARGTARRSRTAPATARAWRRSRDRS